MEICGRGRGPRVRDGKEDFSIMSVLKIALAPVAGLLLLAAPPAGAEDLTVVYKITSSRREGATSTLYISSSRIRQSDPSHDTIFDLASGKVTVIDKVKKEYWESTAEERQVALRQGEEQARRLQDQTARVPPAQLGAATGAVGASVSVQKATGTKKIAGYDCEQYVVSMGETMRIVEWVTPQLPIPASFFDAQKAQFAGNPMMKNYARLADEMSKIKGFPMGETTTIRGATGMGGRRAARPPR